jgi:hypothetical protein
VSGPNLRLPYLTASVPPRYLRTNFKLVPNFPGSLTALKRFFISIAVLLPLHHADGRTLEFQPAISGKLAMTANGEEIEIWGTSMKVSGQASLRCTRCGTFFVQKMQTARWLT